MVNLVDYCPALTVDAMAELICQEFTRKYQGASGGFRQRIRNTDSLDQSAIRKLYQKYSSWEWRYGEAPKFDLEFGVRFPWGAVEIGLKLERGVIKEAWVYSDAMDAEFIGMLPQTLQGVILNAPVMANAVRSMDAGPDRRSMQEDIAGWFMEKDF